MEDFSAKLAQKNMELSKQKSTLEEQIETYKKTVSYLEIRNQVNPETSQQQQTQHQQQHQQEPDQKRKFKMLEPSHLQQADQKPDVDTSLLPSQSQQPVQKPEVENLKPSQFQRQPNFLEKYEFKKLTHFEKMQQERRHRRIQNLEEELVTPETEVQNENDIKDDEEVSLLLFHIYWGVCNFTYTNA